MILCWQAVANLNRDTLDNSLLMNLPAFLAALPKFNVRVFPLADFKKQGDEVTALWPHVPKEVQRFVHPLVRFILMDVWTGTQITEAFRTFSYLHSVLYPSVRLIPYMGAGSVELLLRYPSADGTHACFHPLFHTTIGFCAQCYIMVANVCRRGLTCTCRV